MKNPWLNQIVPFVVSCLPNDKKSVETTSGDKSNCIAHISNPLNLLFVCFCLLPVLNLGQVSGNIRDVFQFATLELPDNLSSRKDISQLDELFFNGFSQKMNGLIWSICREEWKSKQNKFVCSFFGRIYGAPIYFRN